MRCLDLKPTHKIIKEYYQEIQKLLEAGHLDESAVAPIFGHLLRQCAHQMKWQFVEQKRITKTVIPDGAFYDESNLPRGYWEAKDTKDNLDSEITKKFSKGYPKDNILFQSPDRLVIYQNRDTPVFDASIRDHPAQLIEGLKQFFTYEKPQIQAWQAAVEEFQGKIADLGQRLVKIIDEAQRKNKRFKGAFEHFTEQCRQNINPHLSIEAVKEMLIQHLLTERIFTNIFNNPEFVQKNVIAREIDQVIQALTSQSFSKSEFIKENQLDRFYSVLEQAASTIDDYGDKQTFLNTVYERFFQGFAVKVADTHGIVYTPQPIVEFMVKSVEEILQREFGKSLASEGVHIIDPFVGTGNFIVRILREIRQLDVTQLKAKYQNELHCNEVMLLPYYIACMNIEHAFYELTGEYQPFEGICLVDTFELVEDRQRELFVPENTKRVKKQKESPIFVIIGNPPYNVGQQNENDNNKNRKYPKLDQMVSESYAKSSKATNKNALSDVYVKAFKWATWRLQDKKEGIVAFVSNNSFLDSIAFDGMRKHLMENFSKIYHINTKGNARTSGERRKKEGGNVFDDTIRVGVGVTFLVKKSSTEQSEVWIYSIDDYLKSVQKKDFLAKKESIFNVAVQLAQVNSDFTWLTEGLHADFDNFIPMGTKEGKAAKGEGEGVLFKVYSSGVKTNRDIWAYNFSQQTLAENMRKTIEAYNEQVFKWSRQSKEAKIDDFVLYDETKLSWSRDLKLDLKRGKFSEFKEDKLRNSLYRPFTKSTLFFDRVMNEEVYVFPSIFPTPATENENRVICVPGNGSAQITFFISDRVMDLNFFAGSTPIQCFPFYTYSEDGTNRQENLTNWTLKHFRSHYQDDTITKWAIFYYIYGLLHHPHYREKYAANLKRELPRIPLVPDFWSFSKAGERLAELHIDYEKQAEYPLQKIFKSDVRPSYRLEKMRLTKEKDVIIYNETLTLKGIPPEAFQYRLGNRSALEWVIDQYQVSVDGHSGPRDQLEWINEYQAKTAKGSGILNDPNRLDDEQYILRLIGQVITVSVESVKLVNSLPAMEDAPSHKNENKPAKKPRGRKNQ